MLGLHVAEHDTLQDGGEGSHSDSRGDEDCVFCPENVRTRRAEGAVDVQVEGLFELYYATAHLLSVAVLRVGPQQEVVLVGQAHGHLFHAGRRLARSVAPGAGGPLATDARIVAVCRTRQDVDLGLSPVEGDPRATLHRGEGARKWRVSNWSVRKGSGDHFVQRPHLDVAAAPAAVFLQSGQVGRWGVIVQVVVVVVVVTAVVGAL